MVHPEKNTETFIETIKRTFVTTIIIAIILFFLRVVPPNGSSKLVLLGMIWALVFCIVFGGHWLELLFINHIKFALLKNIFLFYCLRIFYWFLCAVPLFALASLSNNLCSHEQGNWATGGHLVLSISVFSW
jgi:hypothetical protein